MKRVCKLLPLLLSCFLLLSCAEDPLVSDPDTATVFTDSAGHQVSLEGPPARVAVLLSSLADIWTLAGGEVAITVGESVERGICAEGVLLVDTGAGKTVDTEALIAAAPDFVIVSADIPAQVEAAVLLRELNIPVAEFRVESFADYLTVLRHCTAITGEQPRYAAYGEQQKERIDAAVSAAPYTGKRVLFIRAGSSARSVKPKASADHFAAAMLTELGAVNIADAAPVSAGGLSMEYILQQDPDYIFFVAMGDEDASRAYVTQMLEGAEWQALTAVKAERTVFLEKARYHYKPTTLWAELYEELAAIPVCKGE